MERNLLLLSLASFFTDTATALVNSVLPLYLVFILGAGEDKLGLVVGIATFVSYLFRVIFGYLSDRWKKQKPFLLVGYGLSAISKPLFALAQNWVEVAFLKSLERLGKAIRTAPRDRYLSSLGREKGKIYGFHKTFDVAGESFGTLLALSLLYFLTPSEYTYKLIFLLTAPFGILALISVLFLEERKPLAEKEKFKGFPWRQLPLLLLLALFPLFVWNEAFFLVEVKRLGYPDWEAPFLFLLTGLIQTLLGYPIGKLIDKTSPALFYAFSLLIGGFAVFFLIVGQLVVSFILLGVSLVSFFTSARSFVALQFGERSGTAFGLFYTLYALFGALGSFLIGFLLKFHGEKLAFFYTLLGVLLTAFLAGVLLFKKTEGDFS